MGITQHALRLGERARDHQPRACRAATSAAPGAGLMPIRGHSGVQGGAEMGAYATALPGRRAGRRRESAAALSAAVGLRRADRARPDRGRDGRGGRATASSTCSTRSAATSSTRCPTRRRSRAALARGAAARAPGHRGHGARCWSSRARRSCCCRRRRATSSTTAAPRPRTERRVVFSPQHPGAEVGEARAEWEILATSPRASNPERAHLRAPDGGRPSATRSRASVPFYDGIETPARTRATSSSGAARASATAGCSRRPTAARASPWSQPPERRGPRGTCALDAPRQAVQLDGLPRARPADRRRPRRTCSSRRGRGAHRRRRRATPLLVRSERGRGARPRPHRADAPGQRPDVLPGVQPADRAGARPTRAACPTTTPSSRSSPHEGRRWASG